MIGVVAQLTIHDGKQQEFEQVATELARQVAANEPGCLLYNLFKVKDQPTEYVFMEHYKDQAATEAHRASDHFRTLGRQMGPFLNGAPRIIRTDLVE